jgi:hypothetical protein
MTSTGNSTTRTSIQECFDKLDHSVLLSILAEKIHDPRLLRLIKHLLQAGYLEDWRYHPTLSGAPQGGILSPLLSNIYLDKLDRFIETELLPRFTRGKSRKKNPAYTRYWGQIALRIPPDVIERKTAIYERRGKPVRRTSLVNCTDYTILNTFQQQYRGLVEYYGLANNLHWLNRVRWAAERSLTCTLAAKHRCRAAKMAKQYRTTIQTPHGPRKCVEATLPRGNKAPRVARFGGIALVPNKKAIVVDSVSPPIRYERREVVRRLIAGKCELCSIKDENCVVHQVRKLADLTNRGKHRPPWALIMLKRRRKTLIVCQPSHHAIHDG